MQRNLYVFRNLQLPVPVPLLPYGKLTTGTLIKPKSTVDSLTYDVETGLTEDVKLTKVSYLQPGCVIAAHSTVTISEVTFDTLTSKLDEDYFFDMTNESKITANPEHFHDLVDKYNQVQSDKEVLAREIALLSHSADELKRGFLESKEFYQQRIGELQERNTSLVLENEAESQEVERLNDTLIQEERVMLLETERFKSELVDKVSKLDKLSSQIVKLEKAFDTVASSQKDSTHKVAKLRELFSRFADYTELPALESIKANLVGLVERAHEDAEASKMLISDLARLKDKEISELKEKVEVEKSDKDVLVDIISQLVSKAKLSDDISDLELQNKIVALADRNAHVASLLSELDTRDSEISTLKRTIDSHNKEIESLCDQNASIVIDVSMANNYNEELRERVSDLEVTNRKYECEIELLNKAISRVKIPISDSSFIGSDDVIGTLSSKVEMFADSFDIMSSLNSDLEQQVRELELRNKDLVADVAKLSCEIEMLNHNVSNCVKISADEFRSDKTEDCILQFENNRLCQMNDSLALENQDLIERLRKFECEIELLNKRHLNDECDCCDGCKCDPVSTCGSNCKKAVSIDDFESSDLKEKLAITEQVCEELLAKYEESIAIRDDLNNTVNSLSEQNTSLLCDLDRLGNELEQHKKGSICHLQHSTLKARCSELELKASEFGETESRMKSDIATAEKRIADLKELLENSKHENFQEVRLLTERTELVRLLTESLCEIKSENQLLIESKHNTDSELIHERENIRELEKTISDCCSLIDAVLGTHKHSDLKTRIISLCSKFENRKQTARVYASRIDTADSEIGKLRNLENQHNAKIKAALFEIESLRDKFDLLQNIDTKDVTHECDEFESRVAELEVVNESLTIDNDSLRTRVSDVENQLLIANNKLDDYDERFNSLKEDMDDKITSLERLFKIDEELQKQNSIIKSQNDTLNVQLEKRNADYSALHHKNDLLTASYTELKLLYSKMQDERSGASIEGCDGNPEIEDSSELLIGKNVEIANLRLELLQLQEEYNKTVSEANAFAAQIDELKGYIVKLSEVVQLASSQYETDNEHIASLESELGKRLVKLNSANIANTELQDRVDYLESQLKSVVLPTSNVSAQSSSNDEIEMMDIINTQLEAIKQLEKELTEAHKARHQSDERHKFALHDEKESSNGLFVALGSLEDKYRESQKEVSHLMKELKAEKDSHSKMSDIIDHQVKVIVELERELEVTKRIDSQVIANDENLSEVVSMQYLAVANLTTELNDEKKLSAHYKKLNISMVGELGIVSEAYSELEQRTNEQALEILSLKERISILESDRSEVSCSVADPECFSPVVTQCGCSRELEFMRDKILGLEDYCNSYKAKMQKLADMKISEGIVSRMMAAINAEIAAAEKHLEMIRKRSEKKPVDLDTFKTEAKALLDRKTKMVSEVRDMLESVEILIRM